MADNTQSPYIPDPESETDYVLDGFFAALIELAPGGEAAAPSPTAIRSRALALEREHAGLARDELSRQNLRYACAVLAAYEAMLPRLDAAEVRVLLGAAFARSGDFVREKTRAWLDQSADAFTDLVAISKERERLQFGSAFVFERARDDAEAYQLNVHRCFWHDCFVAMGQPELTPVLCQFDENWFRVIDPVRHGVRFERTTTIGQGGTHCPFHFYRTRPKMG
jgi:hypothetical protein